MEGNLSSSSPLSLNPPVYLLTPPPFLALFASDLLDDPFSPPPSRPSTIHTYQHSATFGVSISSSIPAGSPRVGDVPRRFGDSSRCACLGSTRLSLDAPLILVEILNGSPNNTYSEACDPSWARKTNEPRPNGHRPLGMLD